MVRAVLKKTCFEKNAFKVWVAVWETLDTPQKKREIKQKKKFFLYENFCLIF